MMKNKIAFGLCAAGLGIASIGMMGLSSEGQAGFVLAVKITAIGLAIAGAGVILNKLKEHATLGKYMLQTNDIGKKTMSGVYQTGDEK